MPHLLAPSGFSGLRQDHIMWRRRVSKEPVALPEGPFPTEGGDAYLAMAQARLDQQMATWDGLDSKASNHMMGALAEAAFLLALVAVTWSPDKGLSAASWVCLALAAVGTCGVVALAWSAQRVRQASTYPKPDDAWESAWKANHEAQPVAWQLARSLEEAFKQNAGVQSRKANTVERSSWALLALTAVVTVAGLVLVFTAPG
jgi:hypothetical protein